MKTDLEIAEVLNDFSSNIVQDLNISRYSNNKPLVHNTNDATLKAIFKYRNHPSIIAIQNKCKDKSNFNFIEVHQKQIEKEILNLDVNKASQRCDSPIKVLKEITNIFNNFLCNSFSNSIIRNFLKFLNMQILPLCTKKIKNNPTETTDQ